MAQQMSASGSDLATLVFPVVGMDDTGHVVLRKRLARRALRHCSAPWSPLRMGMAACGRAHDSARRFREHGHEARLIAPPFVNASVKPPKHEARDADAICEAVTRRTLRCVPIQQPEQPELRALRRVRERLVKARTAWVKEIRGLLSESGIVLPQGITKFRTAVVPQLEDEQAQRTPLSTEVFWQLYDESLALEQQVAYDHEKHTAMARAHSVCQHISTGSYPVSRSMAQAIRLPSVEGEPERDAGVPTIMSSSSAPLGRARRG